MSKKLLAMIFITLISVMLISGCAQTKPIERSSTQTIASSDAETSQSIEEVDTLNENLEDEELGNELDSMSDSLINW